MQDAKLDILINYIQELESTVDSMNTQLGLMQKNITELQNSTFKAKCESIYLDTQSKIQDYSNELSKAKNSLYDTLKIGVDQMKVEGHSILAKTLDKVNVDGMLAWLKNGLDNLTETFDKAIDKVSNMQTSIQQSKGYLKNAGKVLKGEKPQSVKIDHDHGFLASIQEKLFKMMEKTTSVSQKIGDTLNKSEVFKEKVAKETQGMSLKERMSQAKEKAIKHDKQKQQPVKEKPIQIGK